MNAEQKLETIKNLLKEILRVIDLPKTRVDWSTIEDDYNWVTTDSTGMVKWRVAPVWNNDHGVYLIPLGCVGTRNWEYIDHIKYPRSFAKRPTEGDTQ